MTLFTNISPQQHPLEVLLDGVCQRLELRTLRIAQAWFPFTHLWFCSRYIWLILFFVIFISTHHLELSIDLVLLEDLLVLLLHLHQDGVDEVVAVGCNRPNLQMMM